MTRAQGDPPPPRLYSPAAERNREPILAQLRHVLPARGVALEIASGTGQHAAHLAAGLPGWTWHPSDIEADALDSIVTWTDGLANVRPPLRLDVTSLPWPVATVDAVFCANMLHIAPWSTCRALMRGAALHLASQGVLVTYGPYFADGEAPAASNVAFDADLRARDPSWGVRRLSDVAAEAAAAGLALSQRIAMPANNMMLVFRRAAAHTGG